MRSVEINGCRVHVEGVLKGLVSEEARVQAIFAAVRPEVLGISVSKEGLAAMRLELPASAYDLSEEEQVYKTFMENFGEVRLPTPAYVVALRLSEQTGTPIIPLDMNDELYTEAYCEAVGGLDLVRGGFKSRRIGKKRFDISSPQAFVLDWDRKVNGISGFRRLEIARELHMAQAISNLAKRYKVVLALVEFERAEGVLRSLEGMASSVQ